MATESKTKIIKACKTALIDLKLNCAQLDTLIIENNDEDTIARIMKAKRLMTEAGVELNIVQSQLQHKRTGH